MSWCRSGRGRGRPSRRSAARWPKASHRTRRRVTSPPRPRASATRRSSSTTCATAARRPRSRPTPPVRGRARRWRRRSIGPSSAVSRAPINSPCAICRRGSSGCARIPGPGSQRRSRRCRVSSERPQRQAAANTLHNHKARLFRSGSAATDGTRGQLRSVAEQAYSSCVGLQGLRGYPEEETFMRIPHLLSTTAAIVLISGGIAAAQDVKKDQAPAPAPAAQQHAPAEKVAPSMAQHPAKPRETTGQATPNAEQHQGSADKDRHERGMKPQAADEKGQKSGEKAEIKSGTKANESTAAEKQGTKTRENAEIKSGTSGDSKSAAGKTEQRSTTGQGVAGAAKLSTEQRTKIT